MFAFFVGMCGGVMLCMCSRCSVSFPPVPPLTCAQLRPPPPPPAGWLRFFLSFLSFLLILSIVHLLGRASVTVLETVLIL